MGEVGFVGSACVIKGQAKKRQCATVRDESMDTLPQWSAHAPGTRTEISLEKTMAGATGFGPATFGVTGRTKFNRINDGCNLFCG
jgi:hypothetical protein